MSVNIKIVPTDDLNSIIAVVNNYVEGLRVGSVEKVASAFYDDAVMYGFGEGS